MVLCCVVIKSNLSFSMQNYAKHPPPCGSTPNAQAPKEVLKAVCLGLSHVTRKELAQERRGGVHCSVITQHTLPIVRARLIFPPTCFKSIWIIFG